MAQSNFAKKLTKDLKRNPKKTAVLALLLLVAIWFWMPLVWKWVKPNANEFPEEARAATPSATTAAVAGFAGASAENHEAKPSTLDWRNLTDLFQSHQLLAAAEMTAELRDPFVKTNSDTEADPDEEAEQPVSVAASAPPETPSPAELGLVVRSTLTGGGVRLARINGQLCRVGTVLVVPAGDAKMEYEIVDINPDRVTLASGGKSYALERQTDKTNIQWGAAGERVVLDTLRRD